MLATLIVNPVAGRAGEFDAERVAKYVESKGWRVAVHISQSAEDAAEAGARAVALGHQRVLAFGGDGTLRDIGTALIGSGTALAALPGGTVNVWCREAGIPLKMRGAVDAHLSGQVVAVDVGRADGRPFLLMASAGWDAEIARTVNQDLKARLRDHAYTVRTMTYLPRMRTVAARWRAGLEAEDRPLAMMILSNTVLYAGRFRPNPDASPVDGLLDVTALCPKNPWEAARLAYGLARGHLGDDPAALVERVPELTIETPGIPVQLDGDFVGHTPMTFSVEPRALLMSIPGGPLPPILQPRRSAPDAPPRRD
jgi:YegS/Rv2252/BmrU family lipid kinase